MDFQQGEQERENGARIAKILATFMDRVEAMELADVPAARGILLQMQAALAAEDVGRALDDQGAWPQAIANGLDVAKVSTSLFLALQATRQCAMIAGGGPHDRIGAVALTEPGGPRAASVRLAGPPWRLNGRKAFVTNGPVADVLAVFAAADGREVACVIPADSPGVTRGPRIAMPGLNGLTVCDIEFSDVDVQPEHIIEFAGKPNPRERYVLDADLTAAFACVGLMHRVLGAAMAHASQHERGGRPVLKYQEVGFKLAEMLTATHAADLLAMRATWMALTGNPEAATLVRCARVFCAENAERVAIGAMQVAAVQGYVAGGLFERAWRDVRGLAVAGTTLEVARMAIADELLGRV
jgi:alkylation response protein AidB-like acyl-CoA dehydrogenase